MVMKNTASISKNNNDNNSKILEENKKVLYILWLILFRLIYTMNGT